MAGRNGHAAARLWTALVTLVFVVAVPGCFDIDLSGMFADECIADEACPAGEVCQSMMFGNECAAEPARPCGRASACAPGEECRLREEWNVKVTRATCEPQRCTCDSECPNGFVCSGGWFAEHVCAARKTCDADDDCPAGLTCRNRGGDATSCFRATCEPTKPPSCVCDDECRADELCVVHLFDGPSCGSSAVVVCNSDADCPAGQQCRIRDFTGCKDPSRVQTTCESPR